MKQLYKFIFLLVTTILMTACGGGGSTGGDDTPYITLSSASVQKENQSVSSVQLVTGSSPITLQWSVSFSNPSMLYSMTVSAENNSGQTKKLLYQNCGTKSGLLYNCGKSGDFECQVSDNKLDCKINGLGEAPVFPITYNKIAFKACVYDGSLNELCDTKRVITSLLLKTDPTDPTDPIILSPPEPVNPTLSSDLIPPTVPSFSQ
ncbi:MAG: hypothetical protein ACJAS1_006628 [Oleiphilaceae bacterium]|jgi:hypothetical protein